MFSEDEGIDMYNGSMIEFLYAKDAKYEWKQLDIPKTELSCWHNYGIDLEVDNVLDLMTDEFNIAKNLCLCDNLSYYYHFFDGAGPLLIKIKHFEAAIIKGRHRARNTYLESHSTGITQALWKINHELHSKINERNRINNHLLDNMLIHINARVIRGQILLPKENQYMSES